MARGLSESFTLNNDWVNFWTQAKADGWDGSPVVKKLTVVNFNATVAYLHRNADGDTSPTTAADGLPLSNDTTVAPSSAITLENVDLATTWIHTAGNQTISYTIEAM